MGHGVDHIDLPEAREPLPDLLIRKDADAERRLAFDISGCWNGRIMYVFCRQNDIVVGGTWQRENDSETIGEPDRATFERILSNARAMFDGRLLDCVTA
jgi:hypothetical protein